jgi:uncharacterized protein (DUF2237 family)
MNYNFINYKCKNRNFIFKMIQIATLLAFIVLNINVSATTLNSENIYSKALEKCSNDPKTGFYRDGYCNTGSDDTGTHVVCAKVTTEFLAFTKSKGNDLSTPRPWFPGLKNGDYWCLCALRWMQAYNSENPNVIPKIKLAATHKKMLDYTSKENLETYNDN